MSQGQRTSTIAAFAEALLSATPQGAAFVTMASLVRDTYNRMKTPEDDEFGAIIARVDQKLARLGDPNSYTRFPLGGASMPPAGSAARHYGTVLDVLPKAADYDAGDTCVQYAEEPRWVVYGRGTGIPGLPWHEVEFAS